jgi:hypothetical protein
MGDTQQLIHTQGTIRFAQGFAQKTEEESGVLVVYFRDGPSAALSLALPAWQRIQLFRHGKYLPWRMGFAVIASCRLRMNQEKKVSSVKMDKPNSASVSSTQTGMPAQASLKEASLTASLAVQTTGKGADSTLHTACTSVSE